MRTSAACVAPLLAAFFTTEAAAFSFNFNDWLEAIKEEWRSALDSVGYSSTDSSSGSSSGSTTSSSSGSIAYSSGDSIASSSSGSIAYSSGDSIASSSSGYSSSSNWSFSPVKVIQARVQGNMPVWDAENDIFTADYYSTFETNYRSVLDTVNTASVEGAFKYIQAECINASVIVDCERKSSVQYIVMYETTIAQPRAAMAYYQNDTTSNAIEHCPFVAMDGGQCTPTDGVFPDTCNQYIGVNDQPELGFCIGGTVQTDVLAPYPNTYWFSYPNSCPQELWADKTDDCRAKYNGGMCAYGVEPDGVNCTFSWKILGYINLDDVVGITSMVNPETGYNYSNYTEFCEAGNIEYEVYLVDDEVVVGQTIPFWANPTDTTAMATRVETLITKYNALVAENPLTSDGGTMEALPTIASLVEMNPPCYENSILCAEAEFGCSRSLYSQICEVCTEASTDCIVKPDDFVFPVLEI